MAVLVVMVVVVLAIVLLVAPLGKRGRVDQLIEEIGRSEEEEELAQAEDEVRALDAMATPEDAASELPDWGPGVPRRKKTT